jgi:hypothetical protein
MAAVTLLEQSKLIANPQANQIVNVFATSNDFIARLPFEQITGYKKPFTVIDRLPTVNPRDFGVDFVSDFGNSTTYEVPWKVYGGKLEVDKALRIGNPSGAAMQELMQLQALAMKFTQDAFQGTGGTAMAGLGAFISLAFPGQNANAASTTNGGDVITLALMDALLRKCDPDIITMPQIVKAKLTDLARTSTAHNIQWLPNQFGDKIMTYSGVPIVTMINEYDSTDLLSVTEPDQSDGSADTCSVWAVRFGEDGVSGFSPSTPTMMVEQANPGTNFDITNVMFNVGITAKSPRSVGRLSNIKPALS